MVKKILTTLAVVAALAVPASAHPTGGHGGGHFGGGHFEGHRGGPGIWPWVGLGVLGTGVYVGSVCWKQVLTPVGYQWVNVCAQ